MKRFSSLIFALVAAFVLAAPPIANAQTPSSNAPGTYTNGACFNNSDCNSSAGYVCDTSTDTCVPSSSIAGHQSGGGTPNGINPTYLNSFALGFIGIVNGVVVPVLFALAFLMFIWGVVNSFFLGGDNDTKREEGKKFILWAVIAFAGIFSLWGLVFIVLDVFGLPAGGTAAQYGIKPPTL